MTEFSGKILCGRSRGFYLFVNILWFELMLMFIVYFERIRQNGGFILWCDVFCTVNPSLLYSIVKVIQRDYYLYLLSQLRTVLYFCEMHVAHVKHRVAPSYVLFTSFMWMLKWWWPLQEDVEHHEWWGCDVILFLLDAFLLLVRLGCSKM